MRLVKVIVIGITLTWALRVKCPNIVVDYSWSFMEEVFVECLPPEWRLSLGIQRPIKWYSVVREVVKSNYTNIHFYLTPLWISSRATSLTSSSVSLFKAPNWSSSPYRPHAENGGSPLLSGRSEKLGRLPWCISKSELHRRARMSGWVVDRSSTQYWDKKYQITRSAHYSERQYEWKGLWPLS